MAVNLSPVGGVAAQFFTNSGAVLTGGKLYTYAAGTTTPQAAYTTSQGNVPWTNPIVLDAAGRVPSGGEIWLTDGLIYKFVLKDSNDVLIATYDNITGINSNAVAYTNQQEIVTATAGQTVFNLGISYQPGTNSLSVFVDGVNQYGPGAQYSYVETDSTTVTFNAGLHVGAEVKFTTTQQQGAGAVDAEQVSYTPPFVDSVPTNVEAKLAQTVSVKDFGAVGNGIDDDTDAVQAALNYIGSIGGGEVIIPAGTYMIAANTFAGGDDYGLVVSDNTTITMNAGTIMKAITTSDGNYRIFSIVDKSNITINGGILYGDQETHPTSTEAGFGIGILGSTDIYINNVTATQFKGDGIYVGYSTPTPYSQRVHITNCRVFTNYRNGIALTGCIDSSISGGAVYDHLTYAGVGIDLEPDASRIVQNITVANVNLFDNLFNVGIQRTAGNGATLEKINITSNTMREATSAQVQITNAEHVNVVGNTMSNGSNFGIYVLHSSYVNIASNESQSHTSNGFVYATNTSGTTSFINITGNVSRSDYCLVNLVGSVGFTVDDVLIANNICNGASDAVLSNRAKNVSVVSNSIGNSSDRAVYCTANTVSPVIKSNYIVAAGGIGIEVSSNNASIENNTVNNSGKDGIKVNASSCILNGNRVSGSSATANVTYSNILITSADRNHIVANQVRQGSAANLPQYGIFIQSGTSNNVASNDMFQGGNTAAFQDNGTSTTTSNNIVS
jgi:parallel beta-helix repeat protein